MIETWAYAALAEHIYRRNQQTDQALQRDDLKGQGGLSSVVEGRVLNPTRRLDSELYE